MTESMLQAAGLKAIAVGNVGTPILDALRDPVDYDVFAVELSSFQLHWSHSVSPVASVCLNVAEDHVDWHGSYASYLADKAKVYENTQKACIYNAEQIETERMVEDADVVEGCRAVGFTTVTPAVSMVGVVGGPAGGPRLHRGAPDSAAELAASPIWATSRRDIMVANALAAAALVRAYGVEPAAVREGLLDDLIPETTGSSRCPAASGVLWINDSKATNPHAASASLACFSRTWCGSPADCPRASTTTHLIAEHARRLKAVVLIGADYSANCWPRCSDTHRMSP